MCAHPLCEIIIYSQVIDADNVMAMFKFKVFKRAAAIVSIILISQWQTAVSASPAIVQLKRVQALQDRDQDKLALIRLNNLLSKDPNNAQVICQRSIALIRLEKYDQALADANKAVLLAPGLAEAYAWRAAAYSAKARYQEAIADSNKAIALDPNFAQGWAGRAKAYEMLANYQKEVDDINRAIKLEPDYYDHYILLATGLERLGQHQKALEAIKKAFSLMPKEPPPHSSRGYLYELAGDYQKAIREYTAALKSKPQSAQLYLYRAAALEKTQQYRRALNDCNKSLSLDNKQSYAFIERAYINLCLGQLKDALEDCTKAINLSPKRADGYSQRADTFKALGQFRKQTEDLTMAIKLSPQDAYFYENRGEAHYELGEFEKAIDDSKKAINLDPKSYFAHQIAAQSYQVLGIYNKAIEHNTKILEISKEYSWAWSRRAKLYLLLGKTEQATRDWTIANQKMESSERLRMYIDNPLIDYSKLTTTDSPKNQINKLKLKLKDNPIVLPLKIYQYGHMGVIAQVNGLKRELLLDTGCSDSSIWKYAVKGIGNPEKQKLLRKKASGKDMPKGFTRIKSIKLGSLDLQNVAMLIDDEGRYGATMSGYLGGNLLENFVVKVDYRNSTLTLTTNVSQQVLNRNLTMPMILKNKRPCCFTQLDRKLKVLAMIDTGATRSLMADALVKPLLTKRLQFKGKTCGPWLGNLSIEKVKFKNLTLGDIHFVSPTIEVFPSYQAPLAADSVILGNDFLSQFESVTFDYPGRRIIFEL